MTRGGKKHSEGDPFTKIPNKLIRSLKLDCYDKVVFMGIASCGDDAFPSYKALQQWACCSRERVWKSLHKLEDYGLIFRFQKDGKIFYGTYLHRASIADDADAKPVRYTNYQVRHTNQAVRHTNFTSSLYGLVPVRQANPIKNQLKRTNKKREETEILSAEEIGKIIDLELASKSDSSTPMPGGAA